MRMILSAVMGAALALSALPAAPQAPPAQKQIQLAIEARTLADALDEWAAQTGLQFFSKNLEIAKRLPAPHLNGLYSAQEALEKLLADSPLTFVWGDGKVTIQERVQTPPTPPKWETTGGDAKPPQIPSARLRVADAAGAAGYERRSGGGRSIESGASPEPIDVVIVTGTNIRDGQSVSPVLQFTREDIRRSGAHTAERFVQTIPQNFGGGIAARNASGIGNSGGENAGRNISMATGANLRGLGNGSTLVLLNGRRLAPAGFGNAVDLSLIPLSAIERIDVLTDGASAIYGSDAVGGVVNVMLREQFDGAETSARYGAVVDGGYDSWQASQLFGQEWDSGSALVSYEYFTQGELDSSERDITRDVGDPTYLINPDERHSILFAGRQDATDAIELFASGIYSRRKTNLLTNFGAITDANMDAKNYGGTLGATIGSDAIWQTEMAASYSRTDTLSTSTVPAFAQTQTFDMQATIGALDVKVDGTVATLPAGATKLAVGAHYRRESYNSTGSVQATLSTKQRNVYAAFAEVLVPILGPATSDGETGRLALTLAARYEDYNDFGSSTNPKAGIVWSPLEALSLRATAGRSFRAPMLFELDEHSFTTIFSRNLPDPTSASGTTPTLIRVGNNRGLTAETAESWTVGADLSPDFLPGIDVSVTYFDTDYEDRVAVPIPPAAVSTALQSAGLYGFAIHRNPDIGLVTQLFAHPDFFNLAGATPGSIGAIIDNRLTNVARRQQSGIDLDVSMRSMSPIGEISARVSGTYLLEYEDQLIPGLEPVDLVDTIYFPVAFRARGSLGWSRGRYDMTAIVQYVDGYRDNRALPPVFGPPVRREIGSWTTVDLNVGYTVDRAASWLEGVQASLSVQNLFDREPPFAAGPFGFNFDAANADPLGRFVSLQLRKAW